MASQTNDYVWIRDVEGMEEVNNRAYRVQRISSTKFSLQSWNGSSWATVNTNGYDKYDDDGEVRQCLLSDCSVEVTAPGHGLDRRATGVYITGANGMTQINNRPYIVANVTTNTYSIGVNGAECGRPYLRRLQLVRPGRLPVAGVPQHLQQPARPPDQHLRHRTDRSASLHHAAPVDRLRRPELLRQPTHPALRPSIRPLSSATRPR